MSPKIVYTAGVFDLFHEGHLELLEESKKLGDMLIVGVITDQGCFDYKGKYPKVRFSARMRIVQSIKEVDAAVTQYGTDPSDVLRSLTALGLKPFCMTHGDDWTRLKEGNETLEELGIELKLIPRTTGESTSRLVSKIQGVQQLNILT